MRVPPVLSTTNGRMALAGVAIFGVLASAACASHAGSATRVDAESLTASTHTHAPHVSSAAAPVAKIAPKSSLKRSVTAPKQAAAAATGPVVVVSSEAGLQSAIAGAAAGSTIELKAGTYSGAINISRSGTSANPITMKPYGNGAVTLTASLPTRSCGSTGPDSDRTVRFRAGASYWTLSGLTINGGVYAAGKNVDEVHSWFKQQIDSHNWAARRAVPGRGSDNPTAAKSAISYVAAKVHATASPSDGLVFSHDVITRKGMFITEARYGTIDHTTVENIACGSGPGIWLITYSDGWHITNNTVTNVGANSASHYMQEAIRIDGASNYNTISGNTVTNLPTDGRAFSDDQDASYNTFSNNIAKDVFVGFSEEMSGWGNHWTGNSVTGFTGRGFDFGAKDATLTAPSKDSTPYSDTVSCNVASSGTGYGLFIGSIAQSAFSHNNFGRVLLPKDPRAYWTSQGNTWDGSTAGPSVDPKASNSGC